ncbi:hypothetical protein PRZ48_000972 [Zasmidium cellare]|uniref:AB hydrolase-1 domain-containing protein n=1 Tax=Zasmidium cellare TaxID=395010 RepID=A0ABR0F003_ZASCE|nr:hypothetical protein PRZ48_000972 [Zasmidium cellare]
MYSMATTWLAAVLTALINLSAAASNFHRSLPSLPLPHGIDEIYVDCVNSTGLVVHALSAGCHQDSQDQSVLILLHGYPEIAYTWVHIMPKLASNGYCVVAPDLRGAGRTTGWDTKPYSQVDLAEFSDINMVRDLVSLVYGLGYTNVTSVIGHDYGAIIAEWAALIRPDIFTSSVHMSNPFDAPRTPSHPAPIYNDPPNNTTSTTSKLEQQEAALAKLSPPRKYYQLYNSQPSAANDWNTGGALGQRAFLRGYFYTKSADWPENHPHTLNSSDATQLAMIPRYYVMYQNESMSETIQSLTRGYNTNVTQSWLPDSDLDVYISEFQRTGFQGELNWYRVLTSTAETTSNFLMAGAKIRGPVIYLSGEKDWGTYQHPGALESYNKTCADFRGSFLIEGAGHWVQLEQPEALVERVLRFLDEIRS